MIKEKAAAFGRTVTVTGIIAAEPMEIYIEDVDIPIPIPRYMSRDIPKGCPTADAPKKKAAVMIAAENRKDLPII
ncbi:MAG: hypothetical protein IJJ81_03950 [Ruminococcus sp.]|nr:hypothetical protein [Ruminococcus sp.]